MMHPAAKLQFERVVDEFVRWRALGEDERPPAPAWWWGPAMEVQNISMKLPPGSAARLGLSDGATYAAGARICSNRWLARRSSHGRTISRARWISTDSDVRDLHPQPSDDSAFQA